MADLWSSPGFEPSATTAAQTESKEVVHDYEIKYYHELGLGRGVNVTDPDMWKSKTPYLVREACEQNIIGTQECGILERYNKEVSTFEMHQQKLWLSLDNPLATQVKIGMDEHSSRSSSSRILINGKKIEARTISFRFHLDDVPLYDNIDQAVLDAPICFLHNNDSNKFEQDLANWFLKRIEDREKKSEVEQLKTSSSIDPEETPIQKLADRLYEMITNDKKQLKDILSDCEAFLNHLGITHYISAIKLGACEYRIVTSRLEEKRLGSSASMVAGSLAKGELSGLIKKQFSFRREEEQKIGRIDKECVTTEAVIGFEIQPIYKLVRIQYIQMALRKAIKIYIQSKDKKGPYLISTEVNNKPVFWTVSERGQQLVGTESVTDASKFYIIPTGDPTHPSDFHIAFWTKKRQYHTHVDDLYRTYNKRGPPLPRYLSFDARKTLSLTVSAEIKQVQFSLYSRVQSSFAYMMCTSTPVPLHSWLEGEQFYIRCSHHSLFKMDGYIAVTKAKNNGYDITTAFSATGKDSAEIGMLFRLHPTGTLSNAIANCKSAQTGKSIIPTLKATGPEKSTQTDTTESIEHGELEFTQTEATLPDTQAGITLLPHLHVLPILATVFFGTTVILGFVVAKLLSTDV